MKKHGKSWTSIKNTQKKISSVAATLEKKRAEAEENATEVSQYSTVQYSPWDQPKPRQRRFCALMSLLRRVEAKGPKRRKL